jgi:hypothetical protein
MGGEGKNWVFCLTEKGTEIVLNIEELGYLSKAKKEYSEQFKSNINLGMTVFILIVAAISLFLQLRDSKTKEESIPKQKIQLLKPLEYAPTLQSKSINQDTGQ